MSGGSGFRDAFFEGNLLSLAKRQAALLNCPVGSSQQIKDCLMKKEAQEIASSLSGLTVSTISTYCHAHLSVSEIIHFTSFQTFCWTLPAFYPVSKG
jgi:hypothetical protein